MRSRTSFNVYGQRPGRLGRLLLGLGFATSVGVAACGDDPTGGECRLGSEGCACKNDGSCRGDGLSCVSELCVAVPSASCGDGLLDAGEECDNGGLNGPTGACKEDCTLQFCGDGVVGPGELCDDGNTSDADNCNANCTVPSCGNGRLEAAEACDDGNESDTDACTTRCLPAACGDGFLYAEGGEECDDGNTMAGDGCSPSCAREPFCGDGEPLSGELCWKGATPLLAGQAPSGVELADFNADGLLDIAAVSADQGDFVLFLGDGEGSFVGSAPISTLGANPQGLAAGDFDGDGLDDLAMSNRDDDEVVIYFGTGSPSANGALGDPQQYAGADLVGAGRLVEADFDPTGDKDELLVATATGVALVVVLDENSRATPTVSSFSMGAGADTSVAAVDIDGDGFPQAAVVDASSDTLQLVNYLASPKMLSGSGNPAPIALSAISSPRGLLGVDVDNDGSDDLVVGSWDPVACDYPSDEDACTPESFGVLYGDGSSALGSPQTETAGKAPVAFALADLNDDGVRDLLVANRFSDSLQILIGQAGGGFSAGPELGTVGHQPIDVEVGDLDGDGVPDIVVLENYTNTLSVFFSNP